MSLRHAWIAGVSDDAIPHRGEDRIGWVANTDKFIAWAIDGATGLSVNEDNIDIETLAGAYARLIGQNIAAASSTVGNNLLDDVWSSITMANIQFESKFGKPDNSFDMVSASIIVARGCRNSSCWKIDIVSSGDCTAYLRAGGIEHFALSTLGADFDDPFEELAADLHSNQSAIAEKARQTLQGLLRTRRSSMNADGGYRIVAPNAKRECLVLKSFDMAKTACLILMTDGAARFVDKYKLGSWPDALHVVHTHGPHRLISQLREAESSIAREGRVSTVKPRDDASIVYCELT